MLAADFGKRRLMTLKADKFLQETDFSRLQRNNSTWYGAPQETNVLPLLLCTFAILQTLMSPTNLNYNFTPYFR